jgi:hypothetical protein
MSIDFDRFAKRFLIELKHLIKLFIRYTRGGAGTGRQTSHMNG